MAGWGRGRALPLALLAVVALTLSLGRHPAAGDPPGTDDRSGVYALTSALGPENATLRPADDAGGRRWPDGRGGRNLLVLVAAAVVVAGARATGGSYPVGDGPLGRRLRSWLGRCPLAPRAPPFVVQPL